MRPLLSLVAIVKDENPNILATLASCENVVDNFLILDTGSTDGTQEAIRNWRSDGRCEDLRWRGEGSSKPSGLCEEPFRPFAALLPRQLIDYALTRNRALDLHAAGARNLGRHYSIGVVTTPLRAGVDPEPAVFTLFMSGDETLCDGEALRAFLEEHRDDTEGAYTVNLRSGSSRWLYTRVLRTDAKWRYVFPRHEVPIGPNGEVSGSRIPTAVIVHAASDPARRFRRMLDDDLSILTHLAEDPSQAHPVRARAMTYLAQTEESIAEAFPRDEVGPWLTHQHAALAYYRRRVNMGGDPIDVNYAAWHYLNVAEATKLYTSWEMLPRLEALAKADPTRPEVFFMIAQHAGAVDRKRGLFLALEAARIAHEATVNPLPMPTDARCEWLALRIACACACDLDREPQYIQRLVERAIAAGGPPEAFQEFLTGEPPKVAT